jgi:hypothetical protein
MNAVSEIIEALKRLPQHKNCDFFQRMTDKYTQ